MASLSGVPHSNAGDCQGTVRLFKELMCLKKSHIYHSKWTPTEDALLETVVAQVGCKSWALVASRIPGRTPGQCLHRYTYRLAPGNVKGKWTKEEDAYLQLGVDTFGRGKWSQVATLVPTRNDSQCRERWERYLNPEIKKSPWTKEEQDQLKALVATHGLRKWAFISKEMGGTRSDDQLKRMWKTLERERDKEEERLLGLELAEETPRIVSESTTSPVVELAETATRNANGETPVGPSTSRKRPRTKT